MRLHIILICSKLKWQGEYNISSKHEVRHVMRR